MRLTSTIIAVFLALSMAVFPVSMARAAIVGGHHGTTAANASPDHGDHHEHVASSGTDLSTPTNVDDHATSSEDASHNTAPSCCGMGACHVFQISVAPTVSTPAGSAKLLQSPGDEQVVGGFSVRIDRPPRTV